MDQRDENRYLDDLRMKFESYSQISSHSWELIKENASFLILKKGEILIRESQVSRKTFFICKGVLRAYCNDANGNSYNKNLFLDHDFAGSTVSAIRKTPSTFTLESLEDSILISIDYRTYRNLIFSNDDLKDFYIAYLEQNWVVEKEQREVSLVLDDATARYLKFIEQYPDIDKRIPLQHIASHLGVTPTQLSRIRKSLKK